MNQVADHVDVVVTEAFSTHVILRPIHEVGHHISNRLLFEKDASREPATVSIISSGTEGNGNHANGTDGCVFLSFIVIFKREGGRLEKSNG